MDLEWFNNLLDSLIWTFYLRILHFFKHPIVWFQSVVKGSNNDEKFQPKLLINNLMGNFARNESGLINPDEPVEETFRRKIYEQDYDSAIKLAKKFDFDMNLIYQNMWRCQEKSVELIDECLTKITKPLWTLHECVECIPPSPDTLKHLLQFGIKLSSKDSGYSFVADDSIVNETADEDQLCQEKKFSILHKTLVFYLQILNLYEKILQTKFEEDYVEHFDVEFYKKIRNKSLFEITIEFANKADYQTLEILFAEEFETLSKHYLVILSNLPETLSPAKYRHLIEDIFTRLLTTTESLSESSDSPSSNDFEENFYKQNEKYLHYRLGNGKPTEEIVEKWFRDRSVEILNYTLLVDNSMLLLQYAIEKEFPFKDLHFKLDLYSLFLYEEFENLIAFEKFEKLSPVEIMTSSLEHRGNLQIMVDRVFHKLIFKMFSNQASSSKNEALKTFMVKLALMDFEQCLKIFKRFTMVGKTLPEIQSMHTFNDPCLFIELAMECISQYKQESKLDTQRYIKSVTRIFECLPERSQVDILFDEKDVRSREAFHRANDRADKIESYLTMIDVLHEYKTNITIRDICELVNSRDKEQTKKFIVKAMENFFKAYGDSAVVNTEWINFLNHLRNLRNDSFDFLSASEFVQTVVRTLAFSTRIPFIKIAFRCIDSSGNRSGSTRKLNLRKGIEILKFAIEDYIRFSDIKSAQVCLEFFEMNNLKDEEVDKLSVLIEVTRIINEHFPSTSLDLKISQLSALEIVSQVLTDTRISGQSGLVDQLKKINQLLCKGKPEKEAANEAQILVLIGKKCLDDGYHPLVSKLCKEVIERDLFTSWELCYRAAIDDSLRSEPIERLSWLSFALAHCPTSQIDIHYQLLNLVKTLRSSDASLKKPQFLINFVGTVTC